VAFAVCAVSAGQPRGVTSTARLVAATSRDAFTRFLARSRDLGAAPRRLPASLLLLLPDPSNARKAADLAAIYDPHSPRFGKFDTLRRVQRLGPPRALIARVRRTLRALGLSSSWSPGDAWLSVRGSVSRLQRAFALSIHRYRAVNGTVFLASSGDPRLPTGLRSLVVGASHLESYIPLIRHDIPSGGLTPADLLAAYDIAPLRNQGIDGSGQTVVFFEIDGYSQSDFDAYTQHFQLPPMHPTIAAGPSLPPGGEAPMDLEAVHAIAPGARLVVYNLDQNALNNQVTSDSQFLGAFASFQQRIVTGSRGDIISDSVGSCANILDSTAAAVFKQIYDRADTLGEAWFVASGDQGAYGCYQALEQSGDPPSSRDIGVDMPASAPGVTGVGGTRLSVRSDGSWYTEETWEGPAETSGSGGGVSPDYSRPVWQQGPGVSNAALDPNGMREVPDVSAIADPATSGVYAIDGNLTSEGGTSQAAPIWAGIMALIDQYLVRHGGHKLGFANPALYALARTSQPFPPFHDVTLGSNLVYPATAGYDMATGLGTPDAWNLARDLLAYEGGSP
jgi:kumamolisin